MKKTLFTGICLAVFVLMSIVPVVRAAETEAVLQPAASAAGAEGDVLIRDTKQGQRLIVFTLRKMKPNAVYTAEFVNPQNRQTLGIGQPDYSFKTDKDGFAAYSGLVSPEELGKWRQFRVTYHPDGNPKNMQGAKVVLSGPVKQQK